MLTSVRVATHCSISGSHNLRTQNAQQSQESEREGFISDSELASRSSRAHDSWALSGTFPAHCSRCSERASERDRRRGNYRECASGPQSWFLLRDASDTNRHFRIVKNVYYLVVIYILVPRLYTLYVSLGHILETNGTKKKLEKLIRYHDLWYTITLGH